MDKAQVLKAEVRRNRGSKDAARLRKQGQIPAIVYGHKEEPVAISLDARSFVEELHHGRRLMNIQMGKAHEAMLVKEVQYDHLGKEIIHVDLMRVDVTEMVRVTVPIELKGTAKGTHEGGMVEVHTNHVEVECRVTEIPDRISVPIKEMALGDALHAKDLQLPEGVKLISPPELLLATCHVVAEVKTTEELEAEMPAAPEVITEVKKEEEEGAEAAGEQKESKEPKEKKEKKEDKEKK
ncbi:MAG: 50S ribosomal protein L25 [Sedimentisphaerales bacterium]|jgi:large subunit ribosomal protein L25